MIFRCADCDAKLELPDGSEGRKARCPHCDEVIVVPSVKRSGAAMPLQVDEEEPPRRNRERSRDPDRRENDGGDADLEAKAKSEAGTAARWMRFAFLSLLLNVIIGCALAATVYTSRLPGQRHDDADVGFLIAVLGCSALLLSAMLLSLFLAARSLGSLSSKALIVLGIIVGFVVVLLCLVGVFGEAMTLLQRGDLVHFTSYFALVRLILNLLTVVTCLPAAILAISALNKPDVSDYFFEKAERSRNRR
jgi:DNA-directed RNA polymerase subunit RPC12/RpoP